MSKISQELKVLLYLNQRYSRTRWVTINEIAEYLEISDRQARRYLEDLNSITNVEIKTKLGREGGYRLTTPLDKGFAMPENIVLAMSIAMKRNKRIEEVMSTLPNYVVTDSVEGDNALDNALLDKLEVVLEAVQYQKQLFFSYGEKANKYLVNPYKILFTNHTYYLVAISDNVIKYFDISQTKEDLKLLGAFKPDSKALSEIERRLKNYGLGTKDFKTELRDNFDEWYMCPLTIGGMMVSTAQAESDGTGISIRHPYIKSIRKNDIDPKDCTLAKILS